MATTKRNSIGALQAIELAKNKWWELCSHRDIARFQLFTEELCCPFEVFHEAVEKSLGRALSPHDFSMNYDGIVQEFLGERDAPSMQEIIELIPAEKRIIVTIPKEGDDDAPV